MEHFHFLSDAGKTTLPSAVEIASHFRSSGEQIILVLDSSTCLDIVKLVNHKEKAHADKLKIYKLIDYVQTNNVEVLSIFALVESCYDRNTLKLQSDKFCDYSRRIQFAFQFPLKKFKRYEYDVTWDLWDVNQARFSSEPAAAIIDSRINPYYASLLKILQIAKLNGLSSKNAKKNIEMFIDWMDNELNCFLSYEYILALNIFGGNSKYGSMLKVNSSKEVILKAAWGTAWDTFHARMSINRDLISELVDKKVYPIFVAKDFNLYNLMSPYVNSYIKRNFKKVAVTLNEKYPPFFNSDFIDKLNKKMSEICQRRFNLEVELDYDAVKILIKNLEDEL